MIVASADLSNSDKTDGFLKNTKALTKGDFSGAFLQAGLPVTLQGLVGANGKVFGLDHFGHSAPYKVLDEKLGYTAENVFNQVVEMIV